ncbi:hypothetical protein FB567DRAFT_516950 [Paraphoma chrysanthemicola]|uniref:Uncharacterized protein n=1 Tax=Paraphoma chrysanthemicola TaxID=798071 RepID=A0A8K0RGE7_9PLEO|nr:hypothetical protein FB567DRAFT_516950 [Paraphoma chrysanthemicola]
MPRRPWIWAPASPVTHARNRPQLRRMSACPPITYNSILITRRIGHTFYLRLPESWCLRQTSVDAQGRAGFHAALHISNRPARRNCVHEMLQSVSAPLSSALTAADPAGARQTGATDGPCICCHLTSPVPSLVRSGDRSRGHAVVLCLKGSHHPPYNQNFWFMAALHEGCPERTQVTTAEKNNEAEHVQCGVLSSRLEVREPHSCGHVR